MRCYPLDSIGEDAPEGVAYCAALGCPYNPPNLSNPLFLNEDDGNGANDNDNFEGPLPGPILDDNGNVDDSQEQEQEQDDEPQNNESEESDEDESDENDEDDE